MQNSTISSVNVTRTPNRLEVAIAAPEVFRDGRQAAIALREEVVEQLGNQLPAVLEGYAEEVQEVKHSDAGKPVDVLGRLSIERVRKDGTTVLFTVGLPKRICAGKYRGRLRDKIHLEIDDLGRRLSQKVWQFVSAYANAVPE